MQKQIADNRGTKRPQEDFEEIMAVKKLLGQEQAENKKLQEQVELLKKTNANLKRSNTNMANAAALELKRSKKDSTSEKESEKTDAPTEPRTEPAAKPKRGRPAKRKAVPEKQGESSVAPSASPSAEESKASHFGTLTIAKK